MRKTSELVKALAHSASGLFSAKPRLSRIGVAEPVEMRGVLNYAGGGAYSWHPDYQLPESAEHQFRYNLAHGFYDGVRLVGYWGKFVA